MSFYSTAGGSSDVIPPGGLYVGVVLEVGKEDPLRGYRGNVGAVRVSIQELGVTFDYTPVVRGPETNPYVKDDRVICAFLNSRLEEIVILGRINRLPIERMVGINVEEPAYPVHIGGQTTQSGVTLKIDPTSYSGSNRTSIQMHETIMGAGATTTEEGDWYVYDNSNNQWSLIHTGHSNTTAGGLAIAATGTHTTPSGTFTRNLWIQPTYDSSGYEYVRFISDCDNARSMYFNRHTQFGGSIYPADDGTRYLGYSGNRWNTVYATTGTINTSDQNEKTDIADSDLGLNFINALRPVSFKWIDRGGGEAGVRTHYGLLGQEVESVLGDAAPTTAIWTKSAIPASAAVEETYNDNGTIEMEGRVAVEAHDLQGLRYEELIAPLIKAVQELTARVEALEG